MEAVEKDLKDIQAGIKTKGKLADYVLNPSIKRGEKRDFIVAAMGGTKASKLTTNLLGKFPKVIHKL